MSRTAAPLRASSTTGATTSTVVVGSPPASWMACSDAVFTTSAPKLATPAPHANAKASSDGGSASYRSSHRKAATTGKTGTAASASPVTTPRTPVTLVIAATLSRAQPPVISATAIQVRAARSRGLDATGSTRTGGTAAGRGGRYGSNSLTTRRLARGRATSARTPLAGRVQ